MKATEATATTARVPVPVLQTATPEAQSHQTRTEGIRAQEGGPTTPMRIWDLRRGDYDDDRTNPHAHGLRSIVLSALLEFNYLNASITFLALIIGPALLVGLAPSVVVT